LLKKARMMDLGVGKELAGLSLAIVEKDIDVGRTIRFR
jgi:hypothetical protein